MSSDCSCPVGGPPVPWRAMEDEPEALPEVYARYFELRRRGLPPRLIAAVLDIPAEAWEAFVSLAEAKAEED